MSKASRIALALIATIVAGSRPESAAQVRDRPTTVVSGTGVIAGIAAVDVQPSRPLRRVTLTLSGEARTARQTITDDSGRFVFDRLPAGRYTLIAEKPGFVRAFYGSRR